MAYSINYVKIGCEDEDGTLQNDLIGGGGDVISAEPAKRVKQMARLIEKDAELCEIFRTSPKRLILNKIRENSELSKAYENYLFVFGDRCLDELKLESTTLHDNPLPLLRAIGHFAGRKGGISEDHAKEVRAKADLLVQSKLKGSSFT